MSTDPPFDLLARLTLLICHTVGGVDDCTITLMHRQRPVTATFSSNPPVINDGLQGPWTQVLHDGAAVECADLTAEVRWGDFPVVALASGIRSVLSLPVDAGSAGPAALNLYSQATHGFTEGDRKAGLEFAGMAADVIAAASHTETALDTVQRLREVIKRHCDVDRAVGILMARHHCGLEHGYELLVSASHRHGENIHATAARMGDRAAFDRDRPN